MDSLSLSFSLSATPDASLREWVAIVAVHFVTLYSTAFFVLRVAPDSISALALAPLDAPHNVKEGGENPWIVVRVDTSGTACPVLGIGLHSGWARSIAKPIP